MHAEYLRTRSYSTVYQKIYVKIVGKVLANSAGSVPLACIERTYNLYQSNRITLLNFRASIFIYVGTLDFYVQVRMTCAQKYHMHTHTHTHMQYTQGINYCFTGVL